MNINHAVEEKVEGDRLQAIFNRQKELMEKYHHIEARSGLCQTEDCPVNLNDKRGQARLKDFAWRMTEEVGEALDAYNHEDHYQEELIDGLHFLTEFTILAGKDYNTIDLVNKVGKDHLANLYYQATVNDEDKPCVEKAVTDLVREIGMCCNCLKNKPWKQTSMLTDVNAFNQRLFNVWICYIRLLAVSGLGVDDIVNIYLKKSQVNKFRQRSNY
ncbi:hypothetical protein CPD4_73 [Clostridium phage CPD4]|nr:hypothetical protein CPD4_73 [Clostridium phage CPD4]